MKYVWIVLISACTSGLLVREFWPKTKTITNVIPHIVTVHDTVKTVPDWLQDSIKKWKKQLATTDTVTLVVHETIIDTQFVPVNAPPEERPNIWPVLSYHGGSNFGDTANVLTFSLRDGRGDISQVFIPGILTDIEADSTGVPKMTFAPFPEPKKPSLFYRLKMIGIGAGIGFVTCSVMGK